AMRLLARSEHGDVATTLAGLADPDPHVRMHACRRPIADPRVLAAVLELLLDRDPKVRAAAHDAVAARPRHPTSDIAHRTSDIGHRTSDTGHRTSDIGHRTSDTGVSDDDIVALLPTLSNDARRAAYTWLLRALDDDAATLARDALASETDPRARTLLAAVA